jgi:hypothetical protein
VGLSLALAFWLAAPAGALPVPGSAGSELVELAPLDLPVEVVPDLPRVAVADAVARLRDMDLAKPPGPAEAIDWARALHLVGAPPIDEAAANGTLGWVVKNREDQDRVGAELTKIIGLA